MEVENAEVENSGGEAFSKYCNSGSDFVSPEQAQIVHRYRDYGVAELSELVSREAQVS